MKSFPMQAHRYNDIIRPMTRIKSNLTGAIVLGMHDALVSQTGIIAGLTFSLANQYIIIMTGIISAVAAGLSMAASNYLAHKTSENEFAITVGAVTGLAYLITSFMLIIPFFMTGNIRAAMASSFVIAVIIIFGCNFGICRANGTHFWKHTIEMLIICTIVSIAAFIIGEWARYFIGIVI